MASRGDPNTGERAGTRLGPYQLLELLGEGGMGAVYSAVTDAGDKVAIKLLRSDKANHPDVRARFQREWAVLEKVSHPNVIRLIDFPRTDTGPLWYVMELLTGETLFEYLERDEKLPLWQALPLFRELASGLQAVHDAGIVHRDVKPLNVFLCDAPEKDAGFSAKLLDFGFARIVGSQITGSGLLVGTPAYAAPEQASGDKVDLRVDIYALGLVMYRVITGQHPFSTDDQIATLGHQLLSPAPPLSWLEESMPAPLETLILRMLRKRPESRPQSAAEVLHALDNLDDPRGFLTVEEVSANPIDDRYALTPLAESMLKNAFAKKGFRQKK